MCGYCTSVWREYFTLLCTVLVCGESLETDWLDSLDDFMPTMSVIETGYTMLITRASSQWFSLELHSSIR